MIAAPAVAPREWARTHPVTPFIHVIRTVFALLAGFAIETAQYGSGKGGGMPPWVILPLVGGGSLIALAWATLEWRVNLYRIGDDAIYHRKGIVFHQQRQARLDRLQAVDIIQPFIARVFGFADVKVDVAGGRESNVSIKYLKVEDAEALRNEVLALAAGYRREHVGVASVSGSAPASASPVSVSASPVSAAPHSPIAVSGPLAAAPERELYRVPGGRLIGSILVSWSALALLVLAVVAWFAATAIGDGSAPSGSEASASGGTTAVAVWVISIGAVLWAQLNGNANFSAGIAADGIRLSHGLLDTRRQTVPPGRVQALVVRQSLLWRGFDWWKVSLNVAGYHEQKQESVSTLLPVGTRQDALDALWLVLPDLGHPDPAGVISSAMVGMRDDNGFTASPARSWIFDPIQWRHRGVKATDRALLIRRGLLVREFYVIPHERTQSLAIRQGPLQRMLDLATIEVHSTKGVVRPVAAHLTLKDAVALIEDQARRAREGRARQTPEQWMAAVSG